jgi:hypothetical protein
LLNLRQLGAADLADRFLPPLLPRCPPDSPQAAPWKSTGASWSDPTFLCAAL